MGFTDRKTHMQEDHRMQASLPAEWGKVLEDVQAALKHVAEAAAERERALALEKPQPVPDRESLWNQCLARMEARMQGWRAVMQRAEKNVQEVDQELQAREEALKQWVSALQGLRQNLAE